MSARREAYLTTLRLLTRFVLVGAASVGSDVVVLVALHGGAGVPLVPATAVGYGVSLLVNYGLNHAWVFGAEGAHSRRAVRYLFLVGVNLATTLLFVPALAHAGVYYVLAKLLVVGGNAIVNFTAFRFWVFR